MLFYYFKMWNRLPFVLLSTCLWQEQWTYFYCTSRQSTSTINNMGVLSLITWNWHDHQNKFVKYVSLNPKMKSEDFFVLQPATCCVYGLLKFMPKKHLLSAEKTSWFGSKYKFSASANIKSWGLGCYCVKVSMSVMHQ